MGTYTTGIPLITRNIQPPPIPERIITVRKFVEGNENKYGFLYNWYAVTYNVGGASIAPVGWHVPTLAEIDALAVECGGSEIAGLYLKNAGFIPYFGGYRETIIYEYIDYGQFFAVTDVDSEDWLVGSVYTISNELSHSTIYKQSGISVRLIKDDSMDEGTMTDIDGNVYSTVKIGSQVWMAENLLVTRYNNGVAITEIQDGNIWRLLETHALCAYDNDWSNVSIASDDQTFHITIKNTSGLGNYILIYQVPIKQNQPIVVRNVPYGTYEVIEETVTGYTNVSITPQTFSISASNPQQVVDIVNSKDPVFTTIKYGALYNWYAVTDVRNIANTGYAVPTSAQQATLAAYVGGTTIAGGKLKETGTTYWNTNLGTNDFNFNLRGAGARTDLGVFAGIKNEVRLWNDYIGSPTIGLQYRAEHNTVEFIQLNRVKAYGHSIRLIKSVPTAEDLAKADGEACDNYIGNDGKIYRTVKIGTQVWVADNLFETKFRNGDYIHGYELGVYTPISNVDWAALATEGMCIYNDDESNA